VVGLSCAAVHDVPHRRRNELRRVIVDVSNEGFVSISTSARGGTIIVGERNCAATAGGVIKAANSADVDVESVTAKAIMCSLKVILAF